DSHEEERDESDSEILDRAVYVIDEGAERLLPRILESGAVDVLVLVDRYGEASVVEPVELVCLGARDVLELGADVHTLLGEALDNANLTVDDLGEAAC